MGSAAPNRAQDRRSRYPEQFDVTLAHVSSWPEAVDQMEDLRDDTADSSIRMKDMYDLASEDASPKNRHKVRDALGNVKEAGGTFKATAMTEKQKAADDELRTAKAVIDAEKAGEKVQETKKKSAEVKLKGEEADKKAAQAKKAAEGGVFAWVSTKIAGWQASLQTKVLELGVWIAEGLEKSDIDMTGLPGNLAKDEEKSAEAKTDLGAAAEQSVTLDATVAGLQEGQNRSEQNAIQGMYDTMLWLNVLGDLQAALETGETEGNTYMAAVAPSIRYQLDVKKAAEKAEQKQEKATGIDDEYLKPVTSAIEQFLAHHTEPVALLKQRGKTAADAASASFLGQDIDVADQIASAVAARTERTADALGGFGEKAAADLKSDREVILSYRNSTKFDDAERVAARVEKTIQTYLKDIEWASAQIFENIADAVTEGRARLPVPPPAAPATVPPATPQPVPTPAPPPGGKPG